MLLALGQSQLCDLFIFGKFDSKKTFLYDAHQEYFIQPFDTPIQLIRENWFS
jgi:hypothetical protein